MRCKKAHWYLSARCDDTLSEKQRCDLAAHLEECPSCRREAFYFSEIKGQTARVDKVRARADFNLRLQAKIHAWEAEQVKIQQAPASLWSRILALPTVATTYVTDLGGVLLGQRRFAVVGIVTALLTIVIWTGYDSDEGLIENSAALTQEVTDLGLENYYLGTYAEDLDATQSFLVSGVSLSDYTSPRSQPNYVMPTIPAEQVNAQLIF